MRAFRAILAGLQERGPKLVFSRKVYRSHMWLRTTRISEQAFPAIKKEKDKLARGRD